jgi:hypothetical protein
MNSSERNPIDGIPLAAAVVSGLCRLSHIWLPLNAFLIYGLKQQQGEHKDPTSIFLFFKVKIEGFVFFFLLCFDFFKEMLHCILVT